MKFVEKMKDRWGVGVWGVLAILVAFSLAGMTVVRLKGPVMAWILPDGSPGWMTWVVYLVVVMPIYHVFLLAYGSALGQFHFFWPKFKSAGRFLVGRRRRSAERRPDTPA